MITNGSITLWHSGGFDKVTRMDLPPARQYFPAVSIQKDIKVTIAADNELKTADAIKIRIPGDAEIQIKNGDRVMMGEHTEAEAPDNAFTVVGFADNRKGSRAVWHWKVVCA